MKKLIVTSAVCAMLSGAVMAQQSPWMVRARAVNLDMANQDATGLGLTVNNKTIPEVDITYFADKNVAFELVLTVPQKQTVHSSVLAADIGTFKHLPPTLAIQYHFDGNADIKPYVGAGINYTQISNINLLNGGANLDRHSWGTALQVGVDFPINKNVSFNVDVKKVSIKSDVFVGADNKGSLKLDPTMVGMGFGYRF